MRKLESYAAMPAFALCVGSLCACTAGAVSFPDGGSAPPGTVLFLSADASGNPAYSVSLTDAGTFSFDPYAAESSTNGPYIPPGPYDIIFFPAGANYTFNSGNVNVSYGNKCTDTYTDKTVPCDLFNLVLCEPGDESTPCLTMLATDAGDGITTVPLEWHPPFL